MFHSVKGAHICDINIKTRKTQNVRVRTHYILFKTSFIAYGNSIINNFQSSVVDHQAHSNKGFLTLYLIHDYLFFP